MLLMILHYACYVVDCARQAGNHVAGVIAFLKIIVLSFLTYTVILNVVSIIKLVISCFTVNYEDLKVNCVSQGKVDAKLMPTSVLLALVYFC